MQQFSELGIRSCAKSKIHSSCEKLWRKLVRLCSKTFLPPGKSIEVSGNNQQQQFKSLKPLGYNETKAVSHPLIHVSRLAVWELSTIRPVMDGTIMLSCSARVPHWPQGSWEEIQHCWAPAPCYPSAPGLQRDPGQRGREEAAVIFWLLLLFSLWPRCPVPASSHRARACHATQMASLWKTMKLARKSMVA